MFDRLRDDVGRTLNAAIVKCLLERRSPATIEDSFPDQVDHGVATRQSIPPRTASQGITGDNRAAGAELLLGKFRSPREHDRLIAALDEPLHEPHAD